MSKIVDNMSDALSVLDTLQKHTADQSTWEQISLAYVLIAEARGLYQCVHVGVQSGAAISITVSPDSLWTVSDVNTGFFTGKCDCGGEKANSSHSSWCSSGKGKK